MNIRYLVKIGNHPACIFYSFHPKTKMILGVEIAADHIELPQVKWIFNHAPASEKALLNDFEKACGKKCRITYAPPEITFTDFWNKYSSKVGNKPRAKKLWELMNDKEQLEALAGIDVYNAFLRQNPNLTKAYPETYLSQERWKN